MPAAGSTRVIFAGNIMLGRNVAEANVSMVSLANNHVLDFACGVCAMRVWTGPCRPYIGVAQPSPEVVQPGRNARHGRIEPGGLWTQTMLHAYSGRQR
jgi:hypothetical protein